MCGFVSAGCQVGRSNPCEDGLILLGWQTGNQNDPGAASLRSSRPARCAWSLVLDEGKPVGAAARDLDLTESSLRNWVEQARADRTQGKTGLTTAEREELAHLRKENRILLEEREILKKATAFFAKQNR